MKRYILIVGGNGVGESTLYQTLQSLKAMPRLNTDEIIREFDDRRNTADVIRGGRARLSRLCNKRLRCG